MSRCRTAVASLCLCVFLAVGCGSSNPPASTVVSPSTKNQWTWVSGSNIANQPGSYGQQGIAAFTNIPPARYGALSWTDRSGNFWLYGGTAAPPATNSLVLSDLWKFNDGQWTWISGSNATDQSPVYGTLGVPAPGNTPGARFEAATWVDSSGNLWLFGGGGAIANQKTLGLNDLWRYSNGEWTWMGGPQVTASSNSGVYGTKGVAAASNLPSGRDSAVAWTDRLGNFWLFGGFGYSSLGLVGDLNDLWEYSNGQWTWVSGSNVSEQLSVYGAPGVPAPANVPSGREGSVGWLDASGNLWLFGGLSTTSGAADLLNDLWRFSNGQWTWMSGSNQPNQQGVFGTQGTASSANTPGARSDAATWVDSSGNFWLYSGYSATATNQSNEPDDLWKYSGGQWTWVGGSQTTSFGTYGTVGTASSTNLPGSRMWSAAWADNSGRLWVFGGEGYGAALPYGYLNDLWMYQP
jgi:N-acetylneuraminic acid mutarotase